MFSDYLISILFPMFYSQEILSITIASKHQFLPYFPHIIFPLETLLSYFFSSSMSSLKKNHFQIPAYHLTSLSGLSYQLHLTLISPFLHENLEVNLRADLAIHPHPLILSSLNLLKRYHSKPISESTLIIHHF